MKLTFKCKCDECQEIRTFAAAGLFHVITTSAYIVVSTTIAYKKDISSWAFAVLVTTWFVVSQLSSWYWWRRAESKLKQSNIDLD